MNEMTQQEWSMIQYWRSINPNVKSEGLVNNLVRRFNMSEDRAWIIVSRLRNDEHTRREQ